MFVRSVTVYLLGTLLVSDGENTFVYANFFELLCLTLLPVIFACSVVLKWKSGGWSNHPLSVVLSRYNSTDWTLVAQDISNEYQQ